MPLPTALAQRLAKRGIVKADSKTKDEVEEEVFAEDYDDLSQAPDPELPPPVEFSPKKEKTFDLVYDDKGVIIHPIIACPQKNNPYHECIEFCRQTWGVMKFQHKKDLEIKREKMLIMFPLPDEWLEVADPTTSRYYYWHIDTDEVSWFPPNHSKFKISKSAEDIQESLNNSKAQSDTLKNNNPNSVSAPISNLIDQINEDKEKKRFDRKVSLAVTNMDCIDNTLDISKERNIDKIPSKEKYKHRKREVRNKADKDGIDPMDPASYSDIAVGNWSSGLDTRGLAKTGVDSSATGELFQQRPYPSPGDILRANKALDTKEESDEDDELDH